MTEMVRAKSQNISFMNIILIYSWNHVRKYMRDLTPYFIWLLGGKWDGRLSYNTKRVMLKRIQKFAQRERGKRHSEKSSPKCFCLMLTNLFLLRSLSLCITKHIKGWAAQQQKHDRKKKFLTRRRLRGLRDHERTTNQAAELGVAHGVFILFAGKLCHRTYGGICKGETGQCLTYWRVWNPHPIKIHPFNWKSWKVSSFKSPSLAHMGTTKKESTFSFCKKTLVVAGIVILTSVLIYASAFVDKFTFMSELNWIGKWFFQFKFLLFFLIICYLF